MNIQLFRYCSGWVQLVGFQGVHHLSNPKTGSRGTTHHNQLLSLVFWPTKQESCHDSSLLSDFLPNFFSFRESCHDSPIVHVCIHDIKFECLTYVCFRDDKCNWYIGKKDFKTGQNLSKYNTDWQSPLSRKITEAMMRNLFNTDLSDRQLRVCVHLRGICLSFYFFTKHSNRLKNSFSSDSGFGGMRSVINLVFQKLSSFQSTVQPILESQYLNRNSNRN